MRTLAIPLLAALLLAAGCAGDAGDDGAPAPGDVEMELESDAFGEGEPMPEKYTCDGEDVSPPLSWKGVPDGTESFVLIADDPDAPGGTFDHWVLYGVPGDLRSLVEGEGAGTEGSNDFGDRGYGGPCPPEGPSHTYRFRLYALDSDPDLEPGASKGDALRATDGHVLAEAELTGEYAR